MYTDGLLGLRLCHVRRHSRLEGDRSQAVGNDVVQLPGESEAFGPDDPPRLVVHEPLDEHEPLGQLLVEH